VAFRDRLPQALRMLRRRWFRIWEVENYFTRLEQLSKAGAEITLGYVLIALAAAVLATAGLLLNSIAVVIGAMCVAPFLGPSRAVCIGALFRDRPTFWRGLVKQLFGLFVIGAGVGYVLTALLSVSVSGIDITPEVLLRAMPTSREQVLGVVIAVASGAVASLALSADPSVVKTPLGQIFDAVIGLEIAISLMPPATVIGMGLAFGRTAVSRDALLLLLVNVLSLDLVGSAPILALRGVRLSYLQLEKAVRSAAKSALTQVPGLRLAGSKVDVTLLGPEAASVRITARSERWGEIQPTLAEAVAVHVKDETGCRCEVTVDLIPCQIHSTL
jgi:uncharacterized hydrophobic protein (TIGR00271 family)